MTTENGSQLPATQRKPAAIVENAIPMFDTSQFEHMTRIATVMARASLVPDHIRKGSFEEATANCFMIVNQAMRWNMDPFSVAQACFILHGKLGYEGKLVAAMLEAKIGSSLDYEWFGEPGKDDYRIKVSGARPTDGLVVSIEGTVGDWKTYEKADGNGPRRVKGNWQGLSSRNQLAYRGAREWARLYAPGLLLGVYTPDEMEDMEDDFRARRAIDVSPPTPEDEDKPKRARRQQNKFADSEADQQSTTNHDEQQRAADPKVVEGEVLKDGEKAAQVQSGEKAPKPKEQPEETEKSTEPKETKEPAKPVETKKPVEEKKLAETKKPAEPAKPKEAAKPAAEPTMGDVVPGFADIPAPTRKLLQAMHDEMIVVTKDIEDLRPIWRKHFQSDNPHKPWTPEYDKAFQTMTSWHKARIAALPAQQPADDGFDAPPDPGADTGAAADNVNPPNPDDEGEAARNFEQFKIDLKAELDACTSAEEVAAKYGEWTELAVRSGEFTDEQIEKDLHPMKIEAASRFD